MTQEEILALPKRKFLIWLRNFVDLISKEQWCIKTRDNGKGQHCILGFIDEEFGKRSPCIYNIDENPITKRVIVDLEIKKINEFNIVESNNGQSYRNKNIDIRIIKLDNPKDRVLKHINLMLANKI